jgi:hypothetical protein
LDDYSCHNLFMNNSLRFTILQLFVKGVPSPPEFEEVLPEWIDVSGDVSQKPNNEQLVEASQLRQHGSVPALCPVDLVLCRSMELFLIILNYCQNQS